MTNKKLKRLYKSYNRKHFQNKLPDITVRFEEIEDRENALGETIFIGGEPGQINIDKKLKRWHKVTGMVLLHECVHVSLPMKIMHGPRFEARMRRLAKNHAFVGLW